MRKHFALGLAVIGVLSSAADAAVTYRYFRLPKTLLDEKSVAATGFVRDHLNDDTYALGWVPSTMALPEAWQDAAVELDPKAVARRGIDAATLRFEAPASDDGFVKEDYHTYETLTEELASLAATYAPIVQRESVGKSVEGRDLWLMRLASPKGRASRLKLLYVSSMHGDEVTGKELMVYLLRDLLAGYGKDPRATTLLDNAELFIIPSMNPDGTEAGQRWNADGVDLNRNFPHTAAEAESEAGRAPETIALMRLFRAHHFQLALNFHGGDVVVNIPWDYRSNPPGAATNFGDDTLIVDLAREYAKANRPMFANNGGSFKNGVTYGYEWYQVVGGMQDWSNLFRQATHATIELSRLKWPPASKLAGFWSDNRESLVRFLERGLEGVHLKVVDARGEAVPVSVEVSSARRAIVYADGIVHRATIAGTQRVKLSADGFRSLQLEMNAEAFAGDYRTIILER